MPLLLQPGYDPDGWLGMMVGTRLYFDFSSKDHIPANLPRLVRELGTRGRLPTVTGVTTATKEVAVQLRTSSTSLARTSESQTEGSWEGGCGFLQMSMSDSYVKGNF